MNGVSVTVVSYTHGQTDRFGNETLTPTTSTVDNVLVAPSSTDGIEAGRPMGCTASFELHFPKTFTASLEGCDVILPAPWSCLCHVVGKPTPYIDGNTPTDWHMPVTVEVGDG